MSKLDFEEMLNKQSKEEKTIDWEEQKKQWLCFIDLFYNQINQWLDPYITQHKLSIATNKISLTEDYIGTYEVDQWTVSLPNQTISFKPIGTLLIGTKGRIDMEGPRGRIQFILADKDSKGITFKASVSIGGEKSKESEPEQQKQIDWTWKIVSRASRRMSYDEFTEENFFNALMEISNA